MSDDATESLLPSVDAAAQKIQLEQLSPRQELRKLLAISWPVALATLCRVAMYSTDTAFVGHIGTDDLSAVSLAQAWTQFWSVLVWASAYALNSVCAQAIGAGNKKLAGHWLQLALGLVTVQAVPVLFSYLFSRRVLLIITDNNRHVSDLGELFNEWSALTFLPTVWYMAIRQFMQALQVVWPATLVSLLAVGVNAGLNQLLIWGAGSWHGWGLVGSPLATTLSLCFQLGVFICYAFYWKGYHREYWPGWCRSSFEYSRVRRYLKVVLPMTIGSAVENWGYQLITFASGRLTTADVAAMSAMFNIWGVLWTFYWGWGLALQVRVGNHLGAGRPDAARLVAKLSFQIVAAMVLLAAAACIALRRELAGLYSSDDAVIGLVADAMPILALDYAMGCAGLCATNVLEGMARNKVMAWVNSLAMWLVQLPLSLYFAFSCPLFSAHPVRGLWWGGVVGELTKAVSLWYVVAHTDWNEVSREAVERSEASKKEEGAQDQELDGGEEGEKESQKDRDRAGNNEGEKDHAQERITIADGGEDGGGGRLQHSA